ncbi:hypothetical protein SUGI_0474830 [Cryptomeria japonica]|nr:hypothetical protein SUGI_0474830 [Cryptomeria japonica]
MVTTLVEMLVVEVEGVVKGFALALLLLFLSLFSQPFGLFSILPLEVAPSLIEVEMMGFGNTQFPIEVERVVVILFGRSWRKTLELQTPVWFGSECGIIVFFTP